MDNRGVNMGKKIKEYKEKESKFFLERLYGNSLNDLVLSLYDSKSISEQDLKELQELLNKLEGERYDA
jgi:predicted transcriptional regulator